MRPSVSAAVIPMAAVTSRSSLPSSYCDITEQVQRHSTSSRQYSSWSREDFQHFRQRQKQRDSRVLHSRRRRTLGSGSCSSHPYSTAARSPDAQSPTETSAATLISRLEADRNEARRRRTAFSRVRQTLLSQHTQTSGHYCNFVFYNSECHITVLSSSHRGNTRYHTPKHQAE
jgi:hypothetical protein